MSADKLPMEEPQVGLVNSVQKFVIGQKHILNLEDMKLFMEKKELLFPAPEAQLTVDKCESLMNNRMIACTCLGGAFILSLQRYVPSQLGGITLARLAVDMGILTIAMTSGLMFASAGIEEEVQVLKKDLIVGRNKMMMEHLVDMNRMYGFSYHQQISAVLDNDSKRIQSWLAGETQPIRVLA